MNERTRKSNAEYVADFYARNYRIPVVFPAGTKERMEALNLGISNSRFVREAALAELARLEKEKAREGRTKGHAITGRNEDRRE